MRRATIVLSALLAAVGVAVIVVTAVSGGGARPAFGYLFGAGLAAAGAVRLYLALSGPA
jgi:hypothetical protein